MPIASLILGVDLVPIKTIRNVVSFVGDITTDQCRGRLKKELNQWKVDCFLNDGAPNVGANWIHDAFAQAELVVHAVKLACQFLRKGGWFVTKIFRSKEYQSLLWVFNQLFRKVHATKPKASRGESAEIYVICQGFIAPDKIDPKFFDPRFVLQELTSDGKVKAQVKLGEPEAKKPKAEGYNEGDYTLYKRKPVSEFLTTSNNPIEFLSEVNELVFDDEAIATDPITTTEIKMCCKDIKVLGKREIKLLLNWKKKYEKIKSGKDDKSETAPEPAAESEDDDAKLEAEIKELKQVETKEAKKKKRKIREEKRKLRERMQLKMILPGDKPDLDNDPSIFSLKHIRTQEQLSEVHKGDLTFLDDETDDSDDDQQRTSERKYRMVSREKNLDSDLEYESDEQLEGHSKSESPGEESDESELSFEDDDDVTAGTTNQNPLVVDTADLTKESRASHMTSRWFEKEIFQTVEDDDEGSDVDLEMLTKKKKKVQTPAAPVKQVPTEDDDVSSSEEEGEGGEVGEGGEGGEDSGIEETTQTDSDDSDTDDYTHLTTTTTTTTTSADSKTTQAGFVEVPVQIPVVKRKLDAVELALGTAITTSKKKRREIIEAGFNRDVFNDDNLPRWFERDEQKHCTRPVDVDPEVVKMYQKRQKGPNIRTIKKVTEAKARKKQRAVNKMEKLKKKASEIVDNEGDDKEKAHQLRNLYKKATRKKKKEVKYVVSKKGGGSLGKMKGPYKRVDPRMKQDNKKMKRGNKQKQKKGKSKK